MGKKFSELRDRMSPEARARAHEKSQELKRQMPLHELRQALRYTQEQLGRNLGMEQSNVSRLERQTDMYLSTLRSYIEAMGGQLDIVARFPEGDVRVVELAEVSLDDGIPSEAESGRSSAE